MQKLLWAIFLAAAVSVHGGIPVIYCTDLFHPHDDPDDHFDLVTLLSLPELQVKAILLDQGDKQLQKPGTLPLRQAMQIAGVDVPFAIGLGEELKSPTDDGRAQPAQFQGAAELLLKTLRNSREPVTIIAAGSVRDLCAAWNREPALMKQKIGRLYLNIGSADSGQSEYNVDLDPQAYVGLLRSGLPIYLSFCMPMQPSTNSVYSTWWHFRQSEILETLSPEVQNFFIYALQRCAPDELDPQAALGADLRPWRRLIWEMDRNMWCTASFLHAAGRKLQKVGGSWESLTSADSAPGSAEAPFTFVSASIQVDDSGKTRTVSGEPNMHLFKLTAPAEYPVTMRQCLQALLRQFPAATIVHSDVFTSGVDGYTMYRIPAIEVTQDGTLLAFAEARKHSGGDPGAKNQDIDLVLKRSTNNGVSWSGMTVLEDPGEFWSAANPATVVDGSNGRVWLFYLRSKPGRGTDTARPGTDDFQTLARWSDDNGNSWSKPLDLTGVARDLKDSTWRASVPGPGGAIQTRTGRLLVPMWKAPFATFAIYSDDHGRTWQRGELVPGDQGGDECQVAELPDGRILMDIRQELGGHRWLAESTNGGATWGAPRQGVTVAPVACAVEAWSRSGENILLWTGPTENERKRLRILTSTDQGQTFGNERALWDGYAAYSDLAILKDKSVGVLWERGVEHGYQFITFTKVNRAWLDSERSSKAKVLSHVPSAGS